MLTHPTHEALRTLKLDGMAEVFAELLAREGSRQMDPVEWIGLMLDRESAARDSRRFQTPSFRLWNSARSSLRAAR